MNGDKWTFITPEIFLKALGETLQMLGVSLLFGSLLGIVIGTVLAVTSAGGVLPNRPVNLVLGTIVVAIKDGVKILTCGQTTPEMVRKQPERTLAAVCPHTSVPVAVTKHPPAATDPLLNTVAVVAATDWLPALSVTVSVTVKVPADA